MDPRFKVKAKALFQRTSDGCDQSKGNGEDRNTPAVQKTTLAELHHQQFFFIIRFRK